MPPTAIVGVLIRSNYLPNSDPQSGPKFDYMFDWFDRLIDHAAGLLHEDVPAVLAGDFNVVPTDFDICSTKSFTDNALLQPVPRAPYAKMIDMGWTDALRPCIKTTSSLRFGVTYAAGGHVTQACALTTCCSALRSCHG